MEIKLTQAVGRTCWLDWENEKKKYAISVATVIENIHLKTKTEHGNNVNLQKDHRYLLHMSSGIRNYAACLRACL
jgi:rhodanese-related sulfurtransferase